MLEATVKVKSNKNIIEDIEPNMIPAMESVMEYAQKIALQNKRGSKDKNLIPYEVNRIAGEVIGRLYTQFDYAPFLEYGTGIKADGTLPHIGTTATFKASGMRYWFLPKEIADARGKEFAPERIINIQGQQYYIMFATQPYPFMRPTAFQLENDASRILAEELMKRIG